MANAQRNAAQNFTKDTENFLALLRSGTDRKTAEAERADAEDAIAGGAFPGIEQAVAAMKDLIVEIPDDPDCPGDGDEADDEAVFEDPETFEEPEADPAMEDPDAEEVSDEADAPAEPDVPEGPDAGIDEPLTPADKLESSIRALLGEEPRKEGRSALDLLDFEEPDSSRPPYKDVDFEALTASMRRDEVEKPADADDADDEDE